MFHVWPRSVAEEYFTSTKATFIHFCTSSIENRGIFFRNMAFVARWLDQGSMAKLVENFEEESALTFTLVWYAVNWIYSIFLFDTWSNSKCSGIDQNSRILPDIVEVNRRWSCNRSKTRYWNRPVVAGWTCSDADSSCLHDRASSKKADVAGYGPLRLSKVVQIKNRYPIGDIKA